MELKDVILSTLAEMEDETPVVEPSKIEISTEKEIDVKETPITQEYEKVEETPLDDELMYLNSIRERLLVLFEGFQAPNNSNIEAKIDMTLNFLEYTLATIDARVEKLEKGDI